MTFISIIVLFFFFQRLSFIMRPSSLGGGRILRRTLSVCLSVCLSVRPVRGSSFVVFVYFFTVEPSYERTSKIEKNFCFLLWASVTYLLFGTHRGPHIVRPSRPHKLLFFGASYKLKIRCCTKGCTASAVHSEASVQKSITEI